MPGVYDLGTNFVQMLPFVDVEGSGENTTTIKGRGQQVVLGANSSEIRFLTVLNDSAAVPFGFAIFNRNISTGSPFKITNVKAISSSTATTLGNVAIQNENALCTLLNVKAVAENSLGYNRAIFNYGGSHVSLTNVEAQASGGTWADGIRNQSTAYPYMRNVNAAAYGASTTSYALSNGPVATWLR